MIQEFRTITLFKAKKPKDPDLNQALQWFSTSLGLFGERDKEKSCFRIFVELVKAARYKKALTSDQLAARANLSRATVIHHLKRLIAADMVTVEKNQYALRTENLEDLVKEIQTETARVFHDLKDMAEELDEQLGLGKRDRKAHVISD